MYRKQNALEKAHQLASLVQPGHPASRFLSDAIEELGAARKMRQSGRKHDAKSWGRMGRNSLAKAEKLIEEPNP